MSKKRQLHNRLDNLFTTFEEREAPLPLEKPAALPTWTWECDADAVYTHCSPEVLDCLGIQSIRFVGQSLFDFAITPQSAAVLRSTMAEGFYPTEVSLYFQSAEGSFIPVHFDIYAKKDDNDQVNGWRGYAQVLDQQSAPSQLSFPILKSFPAIDIKPTVTEKTSGLQRIGVALENGQVHEATHFWSATARQSISSREVSVQVAEQDKPAAIAVPMEIRNQGMGVIELLDDSGSRNWTEDDRMIAMEIANQLSLALENAQLYSAVQLELAERVKAEEEILRRNEDLARLNQIGQNLSRFTTEKEIFDVVSAAIGEFAEVDNLVVFTFDHIDETLAFPVFHVKGQQLDQPSRKMTESGLPEYLIRTRENLFIAHDVPQTFAEKNIKFGEPMPKSVLGTVLLAADEVTGGIVLLNFERENAFTSIQAELISTIATQTATALENAHLFTDITNALSVIESRERYQGNVARAVATLTEFGTKSISTVFDYLAQATGANRIYFAQIHEDEKGFYWQLGSEWIDPMVSDRFDTGAIQQMPSAIFPTVIAGLKERGFCILQHETAPLPEKTFLEDQSISTSLYLAVPGKTAVPSIIVFDQLIETNPWQIEQIGVLQVAADAISNTITREDLLDQLQSSLDESENLYNASHRLALANDYQEMLAAVSAGLHIPSINRSVMVLFDMDANSKISAMRVSANWYSGHGTPPPAIGTEYIRSVYEKIFVRPNPVFFDDILESQVESPIRELFTRQNIRSMAILPLWTGKRQIGAVVLSSEERHHFTGRELRSFPPLVDQVATSVENQRLFEQTQSALAETELLYKITSGISQATDTQDLLRLVTQNVLPKVANRATMALVTQSFEGMPAEIELVGSCETTGEYDHLNRRLAMSELPTLRQIGSEAIILQDVRTSSLIDDAGRSILLEMNMLSACVVPLRSANRLVGILFASSFRATEWDPEEVRLFQITANGIAVAVERQRLLREAQRRALELQTAAEIARDTASTLSLDELLASIINQIVERFNIYHASVFLLDNVGNFAVVRESSGDAGMDMKRRQHKLAVGSRSIIGTVTATGEPVVVNDVSRSPIYFANPLLPETKSEIGIPLKVNNRVIGALDLQSDYSNAFTQDDISVFVTLSDQIAVAIENAEAYELSQKAYEEMREVDRVKSQFLANMSHELRTPLNSIIGFSRVILKGIDGPVNDTQKQDLSAIYTSGQHLLSLINNILDLSKIEAGKMELQISDVNLSDVINTVMSTASGLVKDKPIKLERKIEPDLPIVHADQTKVNQVLLNFLSNAAKFTDEGTITVEAYRGMSPEGKPEIMICVTDTGPGIAEKDRGKLFLPFSQVDDSPTRKTGGTGLGLSICRSFIEMHKGRIGLLWSEVDKGSTFFFTLPLPIEEKQQSLFLETKSLSFNKILCIDDDYQVISLYERFLKSHGYSVVPLTDPKKAVAKAKEIQPFAITLDIMMPERDGWTVIQDLKNDPDTRNIPVIICSILEQEEKGFSLGAADYLVKPFLNEDLTNAINRLNRDGTIQKVLVIDDDTDDLRLVQKTLEETGKFQPILAKGGKEGLDLFQSQKPDAVILDLFMPDMNGFAVLEKLRGGDANQNIPVLILTGADLTPEQHQLINDFGMNMLTKGMLREKDLLGALENALRKLQ